MKDINIKNKLLFKFYYGAKWFNLLFIWCPLLFIIPAVSLGSIFSEKIIFILLPFIYFYNIKKYLKEKYLHSNINKLTNTFKKSVFLIYFSFLTFIVTWILILKVNVLVFISWPLILISIIMFVSGLIIAKDELFKHGVINQINNKFNFIEYLYIVFTIIVTIYEFNR